MRPSFVKVWAAASLAGLGLAAACAEEKVTVRERPDAAAAGDGGAVTFLSCGVPVPTTYTSAEFLTNAKEELDLRQRLLGLDQQMAAAEGTGTSVVTAGQLRGIYELGTPNLRSVSTSSSQSLVDGYFTAFSDAQAQIWSPELAEADGGALRGGKLDGDYFSPNGLYLREATGKTLLAGALYNHALVVASGPVTEATIDRFVASFGATPALTGSSTEAGPDADLLLASYAARRDDPSQPVGSYRRIRSALLAAKAAAAAGSTCKADLDAALTIFFAEWERVTYASAIYDLNDAASKALSQPVKAQAALHAFGEAVGFIQSFRGIAQDRRKITDAQIDDLLSRMGADKPYELAIRAQVRVPKLVETIQTIAGLYAFTPAEVERFEKVF